MPIDIRPTEGSQYTVPGAQHDVIDSDIDFRRVQLSAFRTLP